MHLAVPMKQTTIATASGDSRAPQKTTKTENRSVMLMCDEKEYM